MTVHVLVRSVPPALSARLTRDDPAFGGNAERNWVKTIEITDRIEAYR